MKAVVVALVFALVLLSGGIARAQQWVYGGAGALATGLEGNGEKNGGPRPARTRLRLDVDLHVDEFPQEIFGFGILADVIPRAAFGVDAHYIRRISPKFEVSVGGIGYLAPSQLFGPSVDLWYRMPLSRGPGGTALIVGPEANVFFFGADLPEGTVIWQGLIQVGSMRIFDRRALVALAMVTSLAAVWNCGSSSTCLRYSDCDQGLTCANGLCVVAGDGDDDDGGDDGGSATTTTSGPEAGTVTPDAATSTVDAATPADASVDAGIADASGD